MRIRWDRLWRASAVLLMGLLAVEPATGAGPAVGEPEFAGEVWLGTLNGRGLWRAIEILPRPDGIPLILAGSATSRSPLKVVDASIEDATMSVTFEMSGGLIALAGTIEGDEVTGSMTVSRKARELTRGLWSARRYRPSRHSASEVLERVRESLGVESGLCSSDLVVRSVAAPPEDTGDSPEPDTVRRFAMGGAFIRDIRGRTADVFDGERFWSVGPPMGVSVPDRRMQEKRILPEWILGYTWLRSPDRFQMMAMESKTGGSNRVFLLLSRKNGVVPGRIAIDPETWIPQYAAIEWDRGSNRLVFEDYRSQGGVLFPGRVVTEYGGKDSKATILSFERAAPGEVSFDSPSPPVAPTYELGAAPGVLGLHGEGENGHLFVRPLVNGAEVGWFHVDTGAPFLMLDEAVANRLELPVIREISIGTLRQLETVQVGQVVLHDVTVVVRDFSDASAPPGEKRAGVLGTPLFHAGVIAFDYDGAKLSAYAPGSYPSGHVSWESLEIAGGPLVTARLNGDTELPFFIDTGKEGAVSFYSQAAVDHHLLGEGDLEGAENLTVFGPTIELVGVINSIELGGRRFDDQSVRFKIPGTPNDDVTGAAGFVGRGLFLDRTVVFDFRKRKIAFLD